MPIHSVSACALVGHCCPVNSTGSLGSPPYSEKNAEIFVESCLLVQTTKRMPGSAFGQPSRKEGSLKSFITSYLPLGYSRFRVDRVNLAAAKQTLRQLWRPPGRLQSVFGSRYRVSRVFLAAAMLTLESFWGRVVLACYSGSRVGKRLRHGDSPDMDDGARSESMSVQACPAFVSEQDKTALSLITASSRRPHPSAQ
ncbi:hypothetical protein PoB_005604200 [Plakobranchus ocellatus]|uniref:Uncharacterized protein n=1 Tax=Plakobranchus ocellatus TaxID=259542 RepID=A0AAV4CEA0_9GAST|nr:hypothetical protein PoB_005604200 [Plakobranchus ocellatus]